MNQTKKLIVNGRVVLPDGVSEVSLLIENGKIKALLDKDTAPETDWEQIDAGGKIVMAGMIDTHNHMADPGPYNFREDWYCGSCSATCLFRRNRRLWIGLDSNGKRMWRRVGR